jgi:hypothetical protein
VVRGYFDGGGANNIPDPVVALAGYFADDAAWPDLENAWAGVIGDGPPMHAAHAFAAAGVYAGWDRRESRNRLGKCVDILAALDRTRFTAVWCLVPADDYERVQNDRPKLKDKPIHAFCVDHTVGLMLNQIGYDQNNPEKFLKQAYFDQNEGFVHHMYRVWTGPRALRPRWVELFDQISTAKSETVLPLQAADVLAWTIYRQYSRRDVAEWYEALTFGWDTGTYHIYNYDSIKSEIQE